MVCLILLVIAPLAADRRRRAAVKRLPDEVGTVAAERRLLEEASDERVLFDAVDVLLTQRSTPLDSSRRPPAAGHRQGDTAATVRGTRRGRRGGLVFVVDCSLDLLIHPGSVYVGSSATTGL